MSSSDDEQGQSSQSQPVKSELEQIRESVEPSLEICSSQKETGVESSEKAEPEATSDQPAKVTGTETDNSSQPQTAGRSEIFRVVLILLLLIVE